MKFKFGIGAKIFLLGVLMCAALISVINMGYRSSEFALNNFKVTTENKYPVLGNFEKLKYSFIDMMNISNEMLNEYSAEVMLKRESAWKEKKAEVQKSLESAAVLRLESKFSKNIIEIEDLIKQCVDHSDEMIKNHSERIKFFYQINGVYIPLSAMISLRELDHVNWAGDLRRSIDFAEEFKGQADPAKCGFGKWYLSAEIKVGELKEIFDKFDAPHKKLHEYAPKIRALISENKISEADKLMKSEVMSVLNDIKKEFAEFRERTDRLYKTATDSINSNYAGLVEKGRRSAELMDSIKKEIENEIGGFVKNSESQLNDANRQILSIGAVIFIFAIFFIGAITKSVNNIINSIIAESGRLTGAVNRGELDVRGDSGAVNFEFKGIIDGINNLMDSFTEPLKLTSDYISDISEGNIPPKITKEYRGDFNVIKNNLNQCIDAVKNMISDINILSQAAIDGRLRVRADAGRHSGDFQRIVSGMNNTLDAVIGPLEVAAGYISSISKGDVPSKITEEYRGDFNEIKNNLNQCIDAINALIIDSKMLSAAACEGHLATRARSEGHSGDFKKIIEGVNFTLDAVTKPVEEAARCLEEMAKGNLSVSVTGSYKGDHAKIKNALNTTIDSMNELIRQVFEAADQVNAGSRQVSDASQSLSHSATEAASSLEEIGASMQQISSQTRLNAENAGKASKLASNVMAAAEEGNGKMADMQKAMNEISESSSSVAKIIKAIDEIAFQTNLLALNAAVEAARAGKHGKGFTVVAEEVRNLAQRSAKAAKETAEMIENSIKKTGMGAAVANETAKSLGEIVAGVTKVTMLVSDIAAASMEQEKGVAQVNIGISQVDKVTQQNTAVAEEAAAASEELSSQSVELRSMLERFKLKKDPPAVNGLFLTEAGRRRVA